MQINGPSSIHGPQSLSGPTRTQGAAAQKSAEPLHGADQLDISHEAEMASRASEAGSVRTDRVADIRAQIQAGTYETQEKLDVAVGRLFDEFAG